jgi:hypothetical protein
MDEFELPGQILALKARLLFNGLEAIVRPFLPDLWVGQRSVPRSRILAADKLVDANERLWPAI